MAKYRVSVCRTMSQTAEIEVEAPNTWEAAALAVEEARGACSEHIFKPHLLEVHPVVKVASVHHVSFVDGGSR